MRRYYKEHKPQTKTVNQKNILNSQKQGRHLKTYNDGALDLQKRKPHVQSIEKHL